MISNIENNYWTCKYKNVLPNLKNTNIGPYEIEPWTDIHLNIVYMRDAQIRNRLHKLIFIYYATFECGIINRVETVEDSFSWCKNVQILIQ